MIVADLVERYFSTKVGVNPNTLANYNFAKNRKHAKEKKAEAEIAKEYAFNADKSNIAAKRYYEMTAKIIEKQDC